FEGLRAALGDSDVSFSIRAAVVIPILATLAAAAWLWRSIRRRRNSHLADLLRKADRKTQRQLAQDLLFFDDLLRLLARRGQRKQLEQTPREYVDRVAPLIGDSASDARWLVEIFYDIRYGAVHVTVPIRERIAQALSRLRHNMPRSA